MKDVIERAISALEKISCLGNGDKPGNSIGNRMAQDIQADLCALLGKLGELPEQHHGCACRWDAEDNRIATCERHQGWLDVVHEWAERAKSAEKLLATAQAQPVTHDLNPPFNGRPDNWQAACGKARRERDEALNRVRELEAALERIAANKGNGDYDGNIAREALASHAQPNGQLELRDDRVPDPSSQWPWKTSASKNPVEQAQPVERVPLTLEQIEAIADKSFNEYMNDDNDNYDVAFARAIESAHGIKEQP